MVDVIPKRPLRVFVRCPIWHAPLHEVIDGALVVKCPSCQEVMYTISRADLDKVWDALAHDAKPDGQAGRLLT